MGLTPYAYLDVPEDQRVCPNCGTELVKVGDGVPTNIPDMMISDNIDSVGVVVINRDTKNKGEIVVERNIRNN